MLKTTRHGRRVTYVATLGAIAIAASACSPGTNSSGASQNETTLADMDPITIEVNHVGGAGQHADYALLPFQEEITDRTDGKVTFENFYGGVLLGQSDQLPGVGDGRADLAMHVLSYDPQAMPIANALYGLAAAPVPSFPHYSLAASAAVEHMAKNNEVYQSDFEESNLVVLGGNSGYMGYDLLCTEPFGGPEDVDGRRVRAPGAIWAEQAHALGMVPVDVAANEFYEGLQRGVVDCGIVSTAQIATQNLWDVASYLTPGVFAGNTGIAFIMNADRFESLPSEVQDIFEEASAELFRGWLTHGVESYSRVATEGTADHGLTFQEPSTEWSDALADLNAEVRAGALAALEEAGVEDPSAFVEDFDNELDHWMTVVVEELDYPLAEASDILASYGQVDMDKVDQFIEMVLEDDLG